MLIKKQNQALGEEQKQETLNKTKMLLAIKDDDFDELLSLLIDDTVNFVLGYCKIEILPTKLESLIPIIVVDRYRRSGYGQEQPERAIKSYTQGSVSKTYEDSTTNDRHFLNNYEKRLKPFVCRKGYVPSDFDSRE